MKDDLRTWPFKIYRLLINNFRHLAPGRYRHVVTKKLIDLYFRSYLIDTQRSDGRWVCLTRDEIGKILEGADHKRFNKNNFYPVMREFVRPGSVAIDVGTSYGDEVIELSELIGPSGRVYAIEPCPNYFPALQRTVALNDLANVVCINKAVGARPGFIAPKKGDDARDDYYLKGRDARYAEQDSAGAMECITLDSLLDDIGSRELSFIKIDTDGFEVEVLEGAHRLLERHPECRLVVEFMPGTDYSGRKDSEVLALYEKMGLKPCRIQMSWRRIEAQDHDYVVRNIGNPLHMRAHDIALIPERESGAKA